MRAFGLILAVLGLSWGASGCAFPGQSGDAGETAEATSAVTVANGLHLNGLHLNGQHLNGLHLNGINLNGLHLDGSGLNGLDVNGSYLAGGVLFGLRSDGRTVGGRDLLGATISTITDDGTPLVLRLDGIDRLAADMASYTISYQAPGAAFAPLCGVVDGVPVQALALAGTWDESAGTPTGGAHRDEPGRITFACQGYALAKCVALGYAPWRAATECRAPGDCHDLTLAPAHQACTRLLRADYCGDGTATTRDGTTVDLWDAVALQTDDEPAWTFEAEWTAGGAACVTATRWPTIAGGGDVVAYIQDHCPDRWQAAGCGGPGSTFFAASGFTVAPESRSLLRSRLSPAE